MQTVSSVFLLVAGVALVAIGVQELAGVGAGTFPSVVYLLLGAASIVVGILSIVRGRRRMRDGR